MVKKRLKVINPKDNCYGKELGARRESIQTTPVSILSRESPARVVLQRRLLLCSRVSKRTCAPRALPRPAAQRARERTDHSPVLQPKKTAYFFLFLFPHKPRRRAVPAGEKGLKNTNWRCFSFF